MNTPKFVAVHYSLDVMQAAYKAASDIHEKAGQRHVTMLVLVAFIIKTHSVAAKCSVDETIGLVRNFIDQLHIG